MGQQWVSNGSQWVSNGHAAPEDTWQTEGAWPWIQFLSEGVSTLAVVLRLHGLPQAAIAKLWI
jgi:hypothetical protein